MQLQQPLQWASAHWTGMGPGNHSSCTRFAGDSMTTGLERNLWCVLHANDTQVEALALSLSRRLLSAVLTDGKGGCSQLQLLQLQSGSLQVALDLHRPSPKE